MLCLLFIGVKKETGKPDPRDPVYHNILTLCYSQAMINAKKSNDLLNTNRYMTCIFTAPDDFFDLISQIHERYTHGLLKGQNEGPKKKPTKASTKGSAGTKEKTIKNMALEESRVF